MITANDLLEEMDMEKDDDETEDDKKKKKKKKPGEKTKKPGVETADFYKKKKGEPEEGLSKAGALLLGELDINSKFTEASKRTVLDMLVDVVFDKQKIGHRLTTIWNDIADIRDDFSKNPTLKEKFGKEFSLLLNKIDSARSSHSKILKLAEKEAK